MSLEPAVEEIQAGTIDPRADEPRVVDRTLGNVAQSEAAEAGAHRSGELLAGPGARLRSPVLQGHRVGLRGVEPVEPIGEGLVELTQHHLIVQAILRQARVGGVAMLGEERLRRAVADELGEALVERCRALHVQGVVGDLMEDQRGQLDRVAGERGRKQRVVEPPQGREGAGRPQVDVVPLGRQTVGGALPRPEIEKPLVRDPADDRVLPGIGADAVLGGRLKHEQQGVAADVRVGGICLLRVEAEPGSVVAALQHEMRAIGARPGRWRRPRRDGRSASGPRESGSPRCPRG